MFHSCFARSQATISLWVLPHIYWDWWNSDNEKNRQMNNNLNINAVEIVKKNPKKTECFHLRAMHTFLIILPSSNILVKLPNLLTCGDKALTSPTKHWYSTVPPIAWLPSFVGLHNGTKLRRGCSFSVNQFSQNWIFFHNGIWWFVTTTQRLIPIWNPFSVSRAPLNQLKQCIH